MLCENYIDHGKAFVLVWLTVVGVAPQGWQE